MFKKVICLIVLVLSLSSAFADERLVAKVTTKGLILANQIEVCAMEDPDIKGITIFYTKTVKKGLIYDEYGTDSSIAVRQTGAISGNIVAKDNILETSSNLFFKALVINRYYDQASNSLIYLIFTKATQGENNAHSISVVSLNVAGIKAEDK